MSPTSDTCCGSIKAENWEEKESGNGPERPNAKSFPETRWTLSCPPTCWTTLVRTPRFLTTSRGVDHRHFPVTCAARHEGRAAYFAPIGLPSWWRPGNAEPTIPQRLAVGRKVNELRTLWRLFSLVTAGPSQCQNICTHSEHSKFVCSFQLAASNQGNRWCGISRVYCGDFNKLMPSRKDFFSELGILVKSWKSILHKSLLPAWTNPYCQCGQILSTPPLSCGQLPHPS